MLASNLNMNYDIKWAYREPNNFGGSKACLRLKVHPLKSGFNDQMWRSDVCSLCWLPWIYCQKNQIMNRDQEMYS